jgi:hypothetical protein
MLLQPREPQFAFARSRLYLEMAIVLPRQALSPQRGGKEDDPEHQSESASQSNRVAALMFAISGPREWCVDLSTSK